MARIKGAVTTRARRKSVLKRAKGYFGAKSIRFKMAKKEKEAKKNQKIVEIKEVRLSATIDVHDLEVKAKNANKFLKNGDKVKVSLKFKGREVRFIEKGKETILKFVSMLEEGQIDKEPKLEGKFLNVIVLPKDSKK